MTAPQARNAIRWAHITMALAVGTYIYNPWASIEAFASLTKWLVFPALAGSGLGLWQGHRALRWLKGAKQ